MRYKHSLAAIALVAVIALKSSYVTQESRLKFALYGVGLSATPILLVFAWKNWLQRVRPQLSPWRNGLCLSALTVLSFVWVAAVVTDAVAFTHHGPIGWDFMSGVILLRGANLAAIALAFALKRASRIETLIAGLLMLICWPIFFV